MAACRSLPRTGTDMFNGWYEVSKDDVWGYVSRTGTYAASYQEYEQKKNASKEP